VLTYGVDVDGSVVNMTVQDSSGDKTFDDYAVACVSAWHFKPTKIDGVPKRVYETTRLSWKPAP
jgi:TonB family protein